MPILLKDVAKQARTSPATVSQVLNGRPSTIRVSETTRRRVMQVATALGYRPNPMARSLRTRRTATIGVVVHGVGTNAPRIEAAERITGQKGYQLLLSVTRWEVEREEDAIRRLLHRQVDGLVLISPAMEAKERRLIERLIGEDFPLVAIGPSMVQGCDYVDWDRSAMYQQVAEHLLSQGCRRLVFFGHENTLGVRQRIDGVKAAVKKFADAELRIVGCDAEILTGGLDEPAKATRQLLRDKWPQAIIAATDEQALLVMRLCRELRQSVPRDVAVTGCSDMSFAPLLNVPLTTIRLPHDAMVERALTQIFQRIDEPEREIEPLQLIMPAELILRESSQFGRDIE